MALLSARRKLRRFVSPESDFCARAVPRPGAGKRFLVSEQCGGLQSGKRAIRSLSILISRYVTLTSASVCLVCSNIATWNLKCHPPRTTLAIAGVFVRDWCFTLGDEMRTGRGQTRVECVSAECRQNEGASYSV